jgi:energy-coupling factor transporter ATP-binding protein EcfA2
VALELLTEPSVLVLDEPTSGLDPGYERSVMQLLRRLADGGRTVIVVTHSTESLHLCDRLLCLTPGGKLAWFGPPARTPAYFDRPSFQEIFQVLDSSGAGADTAAALAPDDLKEKFRRHAAYDRFVAHPLEAYDPDPDHEIDVHVTPSGRWLAQFWTLTRRYARIVASDRRTLFILLATAPILGLVLMVRLPPDQLVRPDGSPVPLFSQAPVVLFIVVISLTQVGISTAAREIVKEREIFMREKTVGLSVSAYVMSKVVVLGVLAVAQAIIVVLIATARQGSPLPGVVLGSGRLELVMAGTLTILAAMALGLLVSAAAKNADHVALVLPAVIGFHMLVSSGEIFPASDEIPVLEQAKVLSSARWGFAAMSSSADTERLTLVNQAIDTFGELELDPAELENLARQIDDLDELDALVAPDSAFVHDSSTFATDLGVLAGMVVVLVAGTTLVLRRSDDL